MTIFKKNKFKTPNLNRLFLYTFVFFILVYTLYSFNAKFNSDDYIFMLVLLTSLVIINRLPIKINNGNVVLNDFIIIVSYFKFNISLTLWIIILGYLADSLIYYSYNKFLRLKVATNNLFNASLLTTSVFLAHITMKLIVNSFIIQNFYFVYIILFSTLVLIYNYIIFHIDTFFITKKLKFITLENGLYYILINFLVCQVLSIISLYLSTILNNTVIIIFLILLILGSYAANSLNILKRKNTVLMNICNCTTQIMSNKDFKTKSFLVIKTIESFLSYDYCGIYLLRDNYQHIYPIAFKKNTSSTIQSLKLKCDSEIFSIANSGKSIFSVKQSLLNEFNSIGNNTNFKSLIIVPIKNSGNLIGSIIIASNNYFDNLEESLPILSQLGNQLSLVYDNYVPIIKNNLIDLKSYSDLLQNIDSNIKNKILFTIAIIEIANYKAIISKYNLDFFESFKNDLCNEISKLLSPYDNILYKKLENIYIEFLLCDSKNAENKIKEIKDFLKNYNFKNIKIKTEIHYSTAEYPEDSSSKEEILELAHKKLYTKTL